MLIFDNIEDLLSNILETKKESFSFEISKENNLGIVENAKK